MIDSQNIETVGGFSIKYTSRKRLKIGDSGVNLYIESSGEKGIRFINLHQNEQTSRNVGHYIICKHGGEMFYITHGDQKERNITFTLKGSAYSVDPNRIFTDNGIRETIKKNSSHYSEEVFTVVKKFSQDLLEYITLPSSISAISPIIALHNNDNTSYSFDSYFELPLSSSVVQIYKGIENSDRGEFFYVTSERSFNIIKEKEIFNVVLQDNNTVEDDGSFSVYAAINNIDYINSEAQHTHYDKQKQMISSIYDDIFG